MILIQNFDLQLGGTSYYRWGRRVDKNVSYADIICGRVVSAGNAQFVITLLQRSVGDQEICLQFVFVADQLAKTLAVESDCPRFLDVRLGERKSARGAAALVIEFKIQLLGISLFWKRCPFLWFTVTQVNHAWLNCDGRLVFTFSECCPAKS